MVLTEEELVDIWKYFQYCCLPSITMARYAYLDYIEDIKKEKMFYRHETKQVINKIGKYLEALPNRLMDVSSQNVRYMNILSDNIEEQFEEEEEELHRAIFISFRNAKWKHAECLASLHYILTMMSIASAIFNQCCEDLKRLSEKDATEAFHIYSLSETSVEWLKIVKKANTMFDNNKKAEAIDLNNIRCTKAVDAIRKKLADIETLRIAMRKSYPWSLNYKEGIPFEESADYLIVNSNNQKLDKCG